MNKISEKEKNLLLDYKECLKKEMFNSLNTQFDLCHKDYRYHRMIASIIDTVYHIDKMIRKSDEAYSDDEDMTFTPEMAHEWAAKMHNADGTIGAHWTKEQTSGVAKQLGITFDHFSDYCFMIAMNSMYADYSKVLKEINADKPEVYAKMAKAFLLDEDSVKPSEKLYVYYNDIVAK